MSEIVKLTNVTLVYPHLFEKHAPPGTGNEAFSAEFLISPNDRQLAGLQAAFEKVAREAGKGDQLQFLVSPVRPGDAENQRRLSKGKHARPELAGKLFIRARDPNYQPPVMAADGRTQLTAEQKDQIFSGCTVNALVDFYWSSNPQNPGVYAGLRGVQLVDNVNVERIGGTGVDPQAMFDAVDGAPAAVADLGQPKETETWM